MPKEYVIAYKQMHELKKGVWEKEYSETEKFNLQDIKKLVKSCEEILERNWA
jgi:hypothetical protein